MECSTPLSHSVVSRSPHATFQHYNSGLFMSFETYNPLDWSKQVFKPDALAREAFINQILTLNFYFEYIHCKCSLATE